MAKHQFTRTEILIGEDGVKKLAEQHVFVAGLGGVGSYCAEALARAGIGRLTLVDHDSVDITNINRQLPALLNTVGQSKADIIYDRIQQINPQCQVTLIKEFLKADELENQLDFLSKSGNINNIPNYLIDCIDSLNSKVSLVAKAYQAGIPVASSMGAGNKLDPSRIKLADISKTKVCPLAKVMRQRLKRLGVSSGILTVYSDEEGRPPLAPEPVAEGMGRPRAVNGTISYMPSIFGLILAGGVIRNLLNLNQ